MSFVMQATKPSFDKIMLSGLIAGGIGRKEGKQTCYFSAAHPQNKAVPDQKSWKPQIVPHVHHKWHTDTMALKFQQTFSYAVGHFADIPAKCIARVVGQDETILYERASEGTPHAPAIQADIGASSGRLLGQDQKTNKTRSYQDLF